MTHDRPFGIVALAVLALLGAVCAAVMAVQVLHLLPPASGSSHLSLVESAAALIFLALLPAFAYIGYMFLTIDLSDWYSSVGISLLNLALLLLSGTGLAVSFAMMMDGVSWQIAAPAVVVYWCTLVHCLLLDKKRAFGSLRT